MRGAVIVLLCAGTPALAHHEVIVATSMVPLMMGLAAMATAALGAVWRARKRRSTDRGEA